jgi:hypothetical protein
MSEKENGAVLENGRWFVCCPVVVGSPALKHNNGRDLE